MQFKLELNDAANTIIIFSMWQASLLNGISVTAMPFLAQFNLLMSVLKSQGGSLNITWSHWTTVQYSLHLTKTWNWLLEPSYLKNPVIWGYKTPEELNMVV